MDDLLSGITREKKSEQAENLILEYLSKGKYPQLSLIHIFQGATQVAFTFLDVLGYLDEIPVCVGYELDGKEIDYFPSTTKLKRCKQILKDVYKRQG